MQELPNQADRFVDGLREVVVDHDGVEAIGVGQLAPGLQYVTKRIILEAAVQLPVVQQLNGMALENNVITTLSVRLNL